MLVPEFSYYITLVFWYLELLVILSVPVIGLVIRQKWRFAVAKEAEIKRLMLLAAEEAARAELEADSVGYYADMGVNRAGFGYEGEVPVEKGYFGYCPEALVKADAAEVASGGVKTYRCAVCLSPTMTRYSRCKSARYCSPNCQIFHWRKGHKDECRPSSIVNQASDSESHPCFNAFETEDQHLKHHHTHQEMNAFSGAGQTEQLHGKKDNFNADILQDMQPSNSPASFSTLFSSESSLSDSDDASTTTSSGSSNVEESSGHQHSDTSDSDQTRSIDKHSGETTKLYVVQSNVTTSSKLNGTPVPAHHDNQRAAYVTRVCTSSSIKASDPLVANSSISDYWEGALNYRWPESVKTKSHAAKDDISYIGSSLHRPSGLYAKTENSNHVDGKMCSNESRAFEKCDSYEVESPIHSSSKMSKYAEDVDNSVLRVSVNKAVKYRSSAAIISPPKQESKADSQEVSNSKKADHTNTINSSSHILKPRRSYASHGEGAVHSVKGENGYPANGVSHSQNASRSSLFAERLGLALNSTELDNVPSMKSRLVGSLPSNSNEIHSSEYIGGMVASNLAKDDLVKSVYDVATSYKSYSFKVASSWKTSTLKAVDHFKASKLSKGCGADESHDNKGMFSFELFKSLYGWNKVELQPCGLVNCGNSCYANAVLQCLSFTPPLTAYLLQGLHSKRCTKRDWCFTCELENLILKTKDSDSPVSPIGIISHLPNIGSHLSNGREEDAHEFLRYVVDTMQSVCIKEAISQVADTMEEETTLLGLTFGGYIESKIRCMKCGNKSERPERIMDLSVEIEGSIRTLEGALERFTSTEILDAENKYNCSRCKSYQKAEKKLTVLEAPNILTIALKRFQGGNFGKLNKRIDFPEALDMAPFMSRKSDDRAPVYKLYGVIVHLDTMNAAFSGHYVCYVKNTKNNWFKIDDSVVKPVEFRKVKQQSAYMLLYARCLPKAPKSLRHKYIYDSKLKSTLPLPGHSSITSGPNSPDFDTIPSSEAYRRHVKFETDSNSDNNSLFSSCSDELSCSTDSSTRESNSVDDLSDLIFGGSGRGFRYPWTSSDSSSPSDSPLCLGHHYSRHDHPHSNSTEGIPILSSGTSSHCSYVDYSSSRNYSNLRQPETERLTNIDSVGYNVPSQQSTSGKWRRVTGHHIM